VSSVTVGPGRGAAMANRGPGKALPLIPANVTSHQQAERCEYDGDDAWHIILRKVIVQIFIYHLLTAEAVSTEKCDIVNFQSRMTCFTMPNVQVMYTYFNYFLLPYRIFALNV
jgi:hypothetical protein